MIEKPSMRATLAQMDEKEVVTISLSERGYNSIRNCASLLGKALGRKYTVSVNNETRSCDVTRVS